MNKGTRFPAFPAHIPREEEQQVRQEATQVRSDRRSRVVMLYGPGGIGKTSLVRELARAAGDETIIWTEPVDADDPEYWLLSNLERKVAAQLDPDNRYFSRYLDYLTHLPQYMRPHSDYEAVVGHLGRIKSVFVQCYTNFVEDTGKTVVIILDTMEAIRGMYLLLTLTRWMKALPGTLFILSGRPLPGNADTEDPIRRELEDDPYRALPVTTIHLAEFTRAAALDYLNKSAQASGLTEEEQEKLVHLTRGHPLWLAFALDYLTAVGLPEEAELSLAEIQRDVPYRGALSPAGQRLHEAFKRRLVTRYRSVDFWPEAVKRLAVVREGVNRRIWRRLMSDRDLPEDMASWDDAWEMLLRMPWIRPRANRSYVTLHDAVAEELAQRLIPLHDQDEQWRRRLWRRAEGIYRELTESREAELTRQLAALDETPQTEGGRLPPLEESAFIERVAELEACRRELGQLRVARLLYQLLCDFADGCRQFLRLLEQARHDHDVFFEHLIALEMQRFLPDGVHTHVSGDVIGAVIADFHEWLSSASPESYLEVGLAMAGYLVDTEQPEAAIELLNRLPADKAGPHQRYRMSILRGNAYMRIPGHVLEGEQHFRAALAQANALTSPARERLTAQAHKELGFYYRNEGLWQNADDAYRQARDAISRIRSMQGPAQDREEMASIQTNWAYVKGLRGSYGEAENLVESAIKMRQLLGNTKGEGISWSVRGEVYRYARQFQRAWDSYQEAERIFQGLRNVPWLGVIYQQQAICLFQAVQEGLNPAPDRYPSKEAEDRIIRALEICRDHAVRSYPSALNRAGRIFGQKNFDAGLRHLEEGINQAQALSDFRFWFANLIEYVELAYRAWVGTGQREDRYRDQIVQRAPEIEQAASKYEFPDLIGRWNLLQGHLAIHDALTSDDQSQERDALLSDALENYKVGFPRIAMGYMGSYGAAALPSEFAKMGELFRQLHPDTRAAWLEKLRHAWSDVEHGSTSLLARLEGLY
jgi:tetratricopeptide (TPR) repeat protein